MAMNGTIKRIVSDKGFGFILASDGKESPLPQLSLRSDGLPRAPEGQSVTFERGQGPKGPRGEDVRVA